MSIYADLSIIILAAGKGTRMKSNLPKVLHEIAGREMIKLVLDSAITLNPQNIVLVASPEMAKFSEVINKEYTNYYDSDRNFNCSFDLTFAFQEKRYGTADAVKIGLNSLKKIGKIILILYGDTPLLKISTLKKMIADIREHKNALCVLGFDCFSDNNYGRLVVKKNFLQKIVEFKDASAKEKTITLCNSGVLAIEGKYMKKLLSSIKNNNANGEYYLTDIIGLASDQNLKCSFLKASENELLGVNSRNDLAKVEGIKQEELRQKFMSEGATLLDPASNYFSFDSKIGKDVVIHPNVVFGKNVEIEDGVEIKSFSHIEGAHIKSGAIIGPFARIRPESIIDKGVHIGNFVEIKKSVIKSGAKINHLSYIGDSIIGEETNIGAGTITCNYDGYKKYQTKIGKKVFIGSNTSLIAPIAIGDGAVIGAGSVINQDVKNNDLAIARAKQLTLKDGGRKYHKKRNKK